jgi:putative ABC transport system permease protein
MRIRAIFVVAAKRLLAQPMLTLSTTLGLIAAITMMLVVPLYAEAVSFRTLSERLAEREDQSYRPPFSYLFTYIGSWAQPVDIETAQVIETYLREQGSNELGLRAEQFVSHYETNRFRLYPSATTNYEDEASIIDYVTFAMTENIENHIQLVEGSFPAPAPADPTSAVDVLITEVFANDTGMQVGDTYVMFNSALETTDSQKMIEVRVAGIWKATNETEAYWFYTPGAFDDALLLHPDTYLHRISPYSTTEVNLAVWYIITDGSGISTSQVPDLIERNGIVEQRVDTLLNGTYAALSPVDELIPYQRVAQRLTILLTAFSIPIVALMIVFLTLVIGLSVEQKRNETAILRSRGTSPFQVIGLATIEGLILGVISLVIGTGFAILITKLMGSVRSFMNFTAISNLQIIFTPLALATGGIAILLAVIIHIVPTLKIARHTVVSYKLERARVQESPIWQRLGIDILLGLVTAYFYYVLIRQGNLFQTGSAASSVEENFANPLLFLMPPLTIFVATLLLLRVLSLFMRFTSWILQLTNNVSLLIATRHLERTPGYYFHPTILLVCTIALGVFTASYARSIDRALYEQQFYRNTSDLSFRLFVETPQGAVSSLEGVSLPMSEDRELSNIEDVTRVGQYVATVHQTGLNVRGTFIGVDRHEFGAIAFWRQDFADQRLGELLNNLAYSPDSVLISREFMEANALQIGDFLRVDLAVAGATIEMTVRIAGAVNYFPRWYPEIDEVLIVGNLDYAFQEAGTELDYLLVARAAPTIDYAQFRSEIISKGITGILYNEPFRAITRGQAQPDRQGLFGLLSIGFIASTIVTVLGFFLYAFFSYRRRFVELGVLRAVGLTRSEMMLSVAWELGLLMFTGLGFGIGIGVIVSRLYIPFMQIGSRASDNVPPYLVTMAWTEITQILVLFFTLFLLSLITLIVVLRRMRIFQAVKLGETI